MVFCVFIVWVLVVYLLGDVVYRNVDVWRKRILGKGSSKYIIIFFYIGVFLKCFLGNLGVRFL